MVGTRYIASGSLYGLRMVSAFDARGQRPRFFHSQPLVKGEQPLAVCPVIFEAHTFYEPARVGAGVLPDAAAVQIAYIRHFQHKLVDAALLESENVLRR